MKIDKRTRLGRIYEAGEQAYREASDQYSGSGHSPPRDLHLLYSMAAMIAEATKQPTRATSGKSKLHPLTKEFYNLLAENGPRIITEPFNKTWHGKLSAQLKKLPDVTLEDAARVGKFVEAKGWWQDRDPTMGKVIHYMHELIPSARTGGGRVEENPHFA